MIFYRIYFVKLYFFKVGWNLKKNDFRDEMCILFEINDVLCRCIINECISIVVF